MRGIRRIFRLERPAAPFDVGHAGVRKIADTAHEGIWLFDAAGRTTFVNRRMAEMLGAAPEELIGTRLSEFVGRDEREHAERDPPGWMRGNADNRRRHLTRRDGADLWTQVSASPIENEYHAIVGMLGMFTDITERMQMEHALRRAETEFRIVFDSSAIGIVVVDARGFAVMANTALLDLLGYRREEIAEISFAKVTHPDDLDEDRRLYQALMRGEFDCYRREKRYVHRNGNVVWVHVNVSLVRSPDGEPQYAINMVEDVTDKYKAERALRASENQLRHALDAAHMGIWDWDIERDRMQWSANVHKIFNLPPERVPGTLEAVIALIVPAERERVSREIGEALKSAGNQYISEYQVAMESGEVRCFEARGEVERDPSGRAVRMTGTVVDITARRKAAELLRQSQERELRAQEEFSRHLLTAQEQERKRLAGELHDGLGQSLSLIRNRMHLALEIPGIEPEAAEHLRAVAQIASEAVAEVRSLAQNLRPIQIEQLGLTESLRSLVEQVADASATQIESRLEDVDDVFQGDAATHLYRIVQEALNNVLKHARAHRATVKLERDVGMLHLDVRDDGTGFAAGGNGAGGLGLTSIRERAQMLGGTLDVRSVPGKGTQVQVNLPFTEPSERP